MSSMDVRTRAAMDRLRDATADVVGLIGTRGDSNDLALLRELTSIADQIHLGEVVATDNVETGDAAATSTSLPTEAWLRLHAGRTSGDARTLMNVAEVLRDMPALWGAVARGQIGWGELRAIAWKAANLKRDQRRALDEALAAQMETLRDCEADVVVRTVDEAIAMLDDTPLERDEQDAFEGRFLRWQLALDGSAQLFGHLDAEALTPIAGALDRLASQLPEHLDPDQLHEDTCPAASNGLDDGATGCDCDARGRRLTAGHRRATALKLICEDWLSGEPSGRRARPSMIITADATPIDTSQIGRLLAHLDVTGTAAAAGTGTGTGTDGAGLDDQDLLRFDGPGHLLWPGRRGPVLLSSSALRRLSCDADTTIVLRHEGKIVGTLSDSRLATPTQRGTLYARDRTCRFPGCTAPVDTAIAHHVTPWPDGQTSIANMAMLCQPHHWAVHHDGWNMTIDDDAVCHFTKGRRTYRTYPGQRRRLRPA